MGPFLILTQRLTVLWYTYVQCCIVSIVAVVPSMFEPVVRRWVDSLWDLSLSRHRDRLSWGIPVPGDEQHTVRIMLTVCECVCVCVCGGGDHS